MKRYFLIAAIALLLCGCRDTGPEVKGAAEAAARGHITSLYPGAVIVGGTCQSADSDGNGYVSCTVTMREAEGKSIQRVDLECGYGYGNVDGCRAPKTYVPAD